MSFWLDSNALVWWLIDHPRLERHGVRERLRRAPSLSISLASAWELWIKQAAGRLVLPGGYEIGLADLEGFELVTPTAEDAWRAAHLPPHHGDPFDRMIIAQALNRDATLITSDRRFADYGVRTIQL